jgi:hypothetical protein
MKETINQRNKRETIEKYSGKTIRDIKYNETFEFDPKSDWFVMFNEPDRFEIIESKP